MLENQWHHFKLLRDIYTAAKICLVTNIFTEGICCTSPVAAIGSELHDFKNRLYIFQFEHYKHSTIISMLYRNEIHVGVSD